MAAQKKQGQINLLPEAGFETTTTGRVMSWILSTFRIIVIVTEIIVMIAFLSRFWLDAQNTDLNDDIKHKTAVLTASKDFEKEFENTQNKLRIFSELTKNQGIYADILNTVVSYLPPDLYLTTITFKEGALQIEGSTPNEVSIQQLIVNLSSSGKFSEVGLIELATDPKDRILLNFKLGTVFIEKEKI
jgi:Tfp pilus assembly protein PilN